MFSSRLLFLATFVLASNLALVYSSSDHNVDVIDLQTMLQSVSKALNTFGEESRTLREDMLEKVSNALKTFGEELKELRKQKPAQDCTEQFKSGFCGSCNGEDWKQQPMPRDCAVLFKSGQHASGVYSILPLGYDKPIQVYCDMTTAGGGWTVFQRRGDYGYPEDYFNKTWSTYKNGFGDLTKEFWLGNDHISALSRQGSNVLRVDLTKNDGSTAYAMYNTFWVQGEADLYKLNVAGYSGTAGDSLTTQSGSPFSTADHGPHFKCAETYTSGWWFIPFTSCFRCNLNGKNLKGDNTYSSCAIIWYDYTGWTYSLFSEMKIRPAGF